MESRSKVTSMRLGQVAGWLEPEALQEFLPCGRRAVREHSRFKLLQHPARSARC